MTDIAHQRAQALLEAQTQFWLQQMGGKGLAKLLKDELPLIYEALDHVSLREAFSEEKVKAIAHRYALEMDISGAIPELAGEIATLIFQGHTQRKTRLKDIVSDRAFDAFLEKMMESGGVVDQATQRMRESEEFKLLLSELVLSVLKGSFSQDSRWLKIGNVGQRAKALRDWIGEKAPDISDTIEESARKMMDSGVNNSVELVLSLLEHERYRESVSAAIAMWWDQVKKRPIANAKSYLSSTDLQEFIVLGYEFWLEFRQSEYLKTCIDGAIGWIYTKYGDETVQTLITEMGVSEETIMQASTDYAEDVAALLVKTGLAESFVRRHLKRFYLSKKTLALLAD